MSSTEKATQQFNDFPHYNNFLGFVDLKSGSYIIAALGVVHLLHYGCTCFMGLSYLVCTTWLLLGLYSVFSALLFYGIYIENEQFMNAWIWYTLFFVALMYIMMLLYCCMFCIQAQLMRLIFVLGGVAWYMMTVYFIFVVNSYRKEMSQNKTLSDISRLHVPGNNTEIPVFIDQTLLQRYSFLNGTGNPVKDEHNYIKLINRTETRPEDEHNNMKSNITDQRGNDDNSTIQSNITALQAKKYALNYIKSRIPEKRGKYLDNIITSNRTDKREKDDQNNTMPEKEGTDVKTRILMILDKNIADKQKNVSTHLREQPDRVYDDTSNTEKLTNQM